MFLEDIKHIKSDKLYVAAITKIISEGFKDYLDVEHASFYLDDVIKAIFNQSYFWAEIYTFEDLGSEGKLNYVYTVDDDGNIYNIDERWKLIGEEIKKENVESLEEIEEIIDKVISSKTSI